MKRWIDAVEELADRLEEEDTPYLESKVSFIDDGNKTFDISISKGRAGKINNAEYYLVLTYKPSSNNVSDMKLIKVTNSFILGNQYITLSINNNETINFILKFLNTRFDKIKSRFESKGKFYLDKKDKEYFIRYKNNGNIVSYAIKFLNEIKSEFLVKIAYVHMDENSNTLDEIQHNIKVKDEILNAARDSNLDNIDLSADLSIPVMNIADFSHKVNNIIIRANQYIVENIIVELLNAIEEVLENLSDY